MQGHVDALGQVKTNQRGNQFFSVNIGGTWYSMQGGEDDKAKIANRDVSFSITKPKTDKFNGWIKVDAVAEPEPTAAAPTARKGLTWDDYVAVANLAHQLAIDLEPDVHFSDEDGRHVTTTDRSTARAAITNSALIAFTNGKFVVDNDDEDDGPAPF